MAGQTLARKICITSPWNYPLFNPENQTHFGGWEVRIGLIAKELARRGNFEVNLVVADHGQPRIEQRDGVTLHAWVGRTIAGIPSAAERARGIVRAQMPSLPMRIRRKALLSLEAVAWRIKPPASLVGNIGAYFVLADMIAIYDQVDADVYLVPGNSQFSAEVALYCQQRGKQYVFLAGSDMDYYPEYKLHPNRRDIQGVQFRLKVFSIEHAALHLAQNERQAQMLREGYGRSATIIKNPIDLDHVVPRNPAARTILWVGKSDERIKRPSLALKLAEQLPEYEFVLIMNMSIAKTHTACLAWARRLPNVTVIERVPFADIENYFADARLHLNTSVFEGFPNTFLQAAKYGVPTVSLKVDPGAMLSERGCGVVCGGDLACVARNLRELMTDATRYARLSQTSLAYVRAVHDRNVIIPQYERALATLCDATPT